MIDLPILLQEICGLIQGVYKSLTDTVQYMNVEIGTKAAQLPEKEHINEIFVAVWKANDVWITEKNICTLSLMTKFTNVRLVIFLPEVNKYFQNKIYTVFYSVRFLFLIETPRLNTASGLDLKYNVSLYFLNCA
jgi:hypothetical protein